MFNRIKLFFTPPTFEDEDKTRIARYLNTLSLIILVGAPIALLTFSINSTLPVQTALLASFIPIAFVNIALVKKGYVRLTAIIFLAASWLIINYSLLGTGGIRAGGVRFNPGLSGGWAFDEFIDCICDRCCEFDPRAGYGDRANSGISAVLAQMK